MDRSFSQNGSKSVAFKILTGKRSIGKPSRWDDSIRMDLKEIGVSTRNWVDLAQDRDYWRALVNAAFSVRLP